MKNIIVQLLCVLLVLSSCVNEKRTDATVPATQKSWTLNNFTKVDSINPILMPAANQLFDDPITNKSLAWEERNVLNPTAVVKDGKVHLFYRAQDVSGTSRIGLAISDDGLHFDKMPAPVFYPANDSMKVYEWNYRKATDPEMTASCKTCYFDGVEDPRIIESEDGKYIMTYTAYDGKVARLSIASSTDLMNWTKHGLMLKDGEQKDLWSKSGAIVITEIDGKNVAKKIDGKYWMYFGDTDLFMATSSDLINWEVLRSAESQKMITVLHPRPGYFDSRLVEPGPHAIYTDAGILLIYNSSNAANANDTELPKFTYAAGQAMYDKNLPYKMIDRTEGYFIHPDKEYEKVGEINDVCFVEGLVNFKGKRFLYYGTADSKIAVAVQDVKVLP